MIGTTWEAGSWASAPWLTGSWEDLGAFVASAAWAPGSWAPTAWRAGAWASAAVTAPGAIAGSPTRVVPKYRAVKQGDTLPLLVWTLQDQYGAPVPLAGSSIRINIRTKDGTLLVDHGVCTIVNPNGQVAYARQPADFAIARTLVGEFEMTSADGILTFPNDSNVTIKVVPQLA